MILCVLENRPTSTHSCCWNKLLLSRRGSAADATRKPSSLPLVPPVGRAKEQANKGEASRITAPGSQNQVQVGGVEAKSLQLNTLDRLQQLFLSNSRPPSGQNKGTLLQVPNTHIRRPSPLSSVGLLFLLPGSCHICPLSVFTRVGMVGCMQDIAIERIVFEMITSITITVPQHNPTLRTC